MIISVKHKIAYLAMPKTGTTSIEKAIKSRSEFITAAQPRFKHIGYKRYERFFKRLLESYDITDVETVCMFREPVDWLKSWYRFRSRDAIKRDTHSTKDLSFEQWVDQITSKRGGLNIGGIGGTQTDFVTDKKGNVGIDHIFRYENFDAFGAFMEERYGRKLKFPNLNTSPKTDDSISSELRARLEVLLADDYKIYNEIAR